ncbi:hypothetical protein FOA52_009176 [Chlamydomonas sp. UWO 241]|nr:hypothetical protein FOA52_009176 [Chlamydomonas sp. UWO 241]
MLVPPPPAPTPKTAAERLASASASAGPSALTPGAGAAAAAAAAGLDERHTLASPLVPQPTAAERLASAAAVAGPSALTRGAGAAAAAAAGLGGQRHTLAWPLVPPPTAAERLASSSASAGPSTLTPSSGAGPVAAAAVAAAALLSHAARPRASAARGVRRPSTPFEVPASHPFDGRACHEHAGVRTDLGLDGDGGGTCARAVTAAGGLSPSDFRFSSFPVVALPAAGTSRMCFSMDENISSSSNAVGTLKNRRSLSRPVSEVKGFYDPPGPEGATVLQRALEKLMMQDLATFARVQASMKGISSLAKETSTLSLKRDTTGATLLNQYVIVKTLGKGSFGKVKLCLNTMDGRMYAVKMVNRAFLLRQLQRPGRGTLRKRGASRTPSTQCLVPSAMLHVPAHVAPTPIRFSLDDTRSAAAGTSSSFGSSSGTSVNTRGPNPMGPLESVMREIAVLKRLDHPNVVRLLLYPA